MTTDYQSLLQKKAELEACIAQVLGREKSDAIDQARALVSQYQLVVADIFPDHGKKAVQTKGEPRYRHPETGATWTGRGKPPRWIEGRDRKAFAI